MNLIAFTGNLGRNAEAKNISGTAVINFAVGVKSGYGQNEQTLWIDCALWGKQAEGRLIEFLGKGQRVSVTGELGTREYQANDGSTKTVLTCRANSVGLEGGSNQSGGNQPQNQQRQQPAQQPQTPPGYNPKTQGVAQQPQQPQQPQQQAAGFDDLEDDIPF